MALEKELTMTTRVMKCNGTTVTLETTIDVGGPILKAEEAIAAAVNEVGAAATVEALKQFDADGEPIFIGGMKWYGKRPTEKYYQTPYGEVLVARYVYQQAGGGRTFCPLEQGARILRNATPRFARMVAHKLAQNAALEVQRDLEENHGRPTSKLLVQELGAYTSAVVQAKEETWTYATPPVEAEIAAVGIGTDGCCLLMCEGQWREAMTGSLSLYDRRGERQHSIYIGAAPEHGKATFRERMEREIAHVKTLYPQARYIGIADGAQSNWDFLERHVDEQILDFYHVAEYVAQAAHALFAGRSAQERETWLESRCSTLKHDWDGAQQLLAEWQAVDTTGWERERRKLLEESLRYFANHLHQMHYKRYQDMGWPIGSGVTEAACKTLVKQRLCRSGMRWKEDGAQAILSLRALLLTPTRWDQFWRKLEQYGAPVIASH
jgi:hypothetical protein